MNCYRRVQILPSPEEFDDDDVPLSRLQFNREEDEEDEIPLVELQRKMRQLPDTGSMTAKEYLVVDEEEEKEDVPEDFNQIRGRGVYYRQHQFFGADPFECNS